MRSDLLRPRALLGHLLVLTVAVACVALGLWQLDRLGQVRDQNARFEARIDAPAVDLDDVTADGDLSELEFRRATATGTFRPDEEVLQRNQQDPRGQQGYHVLTPLDLGDGRSLLVRRGWVPTGLPEPNAAEAAPPSGEVTVTGVLQLPVDPPGFGPQDPRDGRLTQVFYPDTARLDGQTSGTLLPLVLLAEDLPPTADGFPVALDRPRLDEANHRSYAVQWFSFAVLALVTYLFWLRGRSRTSPTIDPDTATPAPTRPGALT